MDAGQDRVIHRVPAGALAAAREVALVVDALDVVDPLAVGGPARHRARPAGRDLDRLVAGLGPQVALLDEDQRARDVGPRVDDDHVRRRRRPVRRDPAAPPRIRTAARKRDGASEQGQGDQGDHREPDQGHKRRNGRPRRADPVRVGCGTGRTPAICAPLPGDGSSSRSGDERLGLDWAGCQCRGMAGRRGVPDLELDRLVAAEDRVTIRATTSSRSPSWTSVARSARPKAIPSTTSSRLRRVSWEWPPLAARTRVTVRPSTTTSGSGFPGPVGSSRRSSARNA